MKKKGGSGRSRSSRSSSSSGSSDDLVEGVAYLIFYLMQISLFLRYFLGGAIILFTVGLIILISTNSLVISFTSVWTWIIVAVWGGASAYGLYYDIIDLVTTRRYRVQGKDPAHKEVTIVSIGGIGPKRKKKLEGIGILTLADLALADPDKIVKAGIPRKLVVRFVRQAQELTGLPSHDDTVNGGQNSESNSDLDEN